MPHRFVYFFGEGQADGGSEIKHLIGGKGASLADMTRAGLNVPPGFTISAECCALFYQANKQWPAGLEEEVRAGLARLEKLAGRQFGQGDNPLLVAVRSGAAVSMPGMMDTMLNVGDVTGRELPSDPWQMLVAAINAVFNSWNSERAVAYRQHHNIDGLLGTAVNVQMMCPAEVSGVVFTANPVNPDLKQIIIESSFGLGEAIVLGKVAPDRFVINKQTRKIIDRSFAGAHPEGPSLTDDQAIALADLGLRVENYFKTPCDIEWAWSQGKFYLLQSRPIKGLQIADRRLQNEKPVQTAGDANERENVRREEIAALAAKAEPGGTVWSRYNLSEILPEPTPMTWAIVRRFMSGKGGFGLMYRDLGFDPDPALDEEGIYDLVCGRPYCNLSREPRLQNRRVPFEHPFAELKENPAKALYPQPRLNPARAGPLFWLLLPWLTFKLFRSSWKLSSLSRTLAHRLREEIFPKFERETQEAAGEDLSSLEPPALLERLEYWIRRTLYDFARDSLKPTVLAAVALGNLERGLRALGPERIRAALGELSMGARPDPEADLLGALRELAAGRLSREFFLKDFGHRGRQEMELAQPRWMEEKTVGSAQRLREGEAPAEPLHKAARLEPRPPAGPVPTAAWERIAAEAKLSSTQRAVLEPELERLHTYFGLRETAKHYLMKGYALIRRILVELDRRYNLDGGVFFLIPEELPRLIAGEDLSSSIKERRRRRAILLSLEMPQVLFSDDLEAIGRGTGVGGTGVPPVSDRRDACPTDTLQGVPLSAGIAEGPALVLQTPNLTPSDDASTLQEGGYILVCPSTDPAWVPLFVRARGLVMETGGVLSHGAIVAREFGLPAVAGLPDVHRRLKTGQRLRVDGARGTVVVVS
jgi:pyruvate,water dikinase